MPANKMKSRFNWCQWTNWINECRADPAYVIVLDKGHRPPVVDDTYFRIIAGKRAKERGCKVHVHVDRHSRDISLQFCWREDVHRGIHG